MVKGLAKHRNRLRHDLRVKCVDASLFMTKSGYSPMTLRFYQPSHEYVSPGSCSEIALTCAEGPLQREPNAHT